MAGIDIVIDTLSNELGMVEKRLFNSIETEVELLNDVSRHILKSGGKRIRPMVVLLSSRLCGYKGKDHIDLACALEFIHTATLLHDDVIDHAEIRRGSSSANTIWGNHATILSGDFLFAKAFVMAVEKANMRVLDELACVCKCMAEAETFQLSKSRNPMLSEEQYLYIINNKTAKLLSVCSKIGALLTGADSAREKALEEYGYNIGMAFQIMDDVLDYCAEEKDFGKKKGKDLDEGSLTLPLIVALKNSPSEDRERIIDILASGDHREENLVAITEFIEKNRGKAYSVEQAAIYAEKAVKALEKFTNCDVKDYMMLLASYIVERKS